MEQPTRAGYPVTFSVDLTGTCAASAEYLTVQVVGLGAPALPTYRTCQQLPLGRCRQCLLFPISLTTPHPLSLCLYLALCLLGSVACLLPALVVRKLKEFRYYFAFFPAAHTPHTHTAVSHSHLLAALWCKLCRRSENKCCICMRHDMSQVLSTSHPHATLSPQLPSLPCTTYPISPYSPPY